jgi:hypothetical protein
MLLVNSDIKSENTKMRLVFGCTNMKILINNTKKINISVIEQQNKV